MRSWPALSLTFPTDAATAELSLSLQDQVSASLDGLDVVAIEEYSDDLWRVCFRDSQTRDVAGAALGVLAGAGLRVDAVDMPDEDWAKRSQAAIHAVTVGRVVVSPPWDSAATALTLDAIHT
jgi:ribosomal protein L11 methylase PrmA